ncbi:hypothetical protein J6590_079529 [Homalodisca vitripennis]|nr:hypothetical protein J6590_079529 [Homalodisca vitripennis]
MKIPYFGVSEDVFPVGNVFFSEYSRPMSRFAMFEDSVATSGVRFVTMRIEVSSVGADYAYIGVTSTRVHKAKLVHSSSKIRSFKNT